MTDEGPRPRDKIGQTFKWAALASAVLVGHIALAMLLLSGIWLMETYLHVLYGERDPKLFEVVPVKYLFDFLDLSIFALFAFWGFVEANNTFRGK